VLFRSELTKAREVMATIEKQLALLDQNLQRDIEISSSNWATGFHNDHTTRGGCHEFIQL